jgi:cell division protein ZapE
MTLEQIGSAVRLTDRTPRITGDEIIASLVPPPQFEHARFDTYRPDRDFPSQAAAVSRLQDFAAGFDPVRPSGFFRRRRKQEDLKPGVYLDGGFGVGKTHLLAALWHIAPERKYYGTFMQYTALVGALGYAEAVRLFTGAALICIDEFELDDPGDTMMMTRMLSQLMADGTRVVATSNTPPNALGEGRFAASDFLREIQSLSRNFDTLRIDGVDYRRRDLQGNAAVVDRAEYDRTIEALSRRHSGVSSDDFRDLVDHLATVHPSSFIKLIDGIQVIGLTDVVVLHDQMEALRFVAFIDRVYDAEIPIVQTGVALSEVFDDEMLRGGYRKKYLRASSRLVALTTGQLPPHDE